MVAARRCWCAPGARNTAPAAANAAAAETGLHPRRPCSPTPCQLAGLGGGGGAGAACTSTPLGPTVTVTLVVLLGGTSVLPRHGRLWNARKPAKKPSDLTWSFGMMVSVLVVPGASTNSSRLTRSCPSTTASVLYSGKNSALLNPAAVSS